MTNDAICTVCKLPLSEEGHGDECDLTEQDHPGEFTATSAEYFWEMDGPLDPERLIADLTFASYCENRRISPHVTPDAWEAVYTNAKDLERRYTTGR
jgi:hypothetical protein